MTTKEQERKALEKIRKIVAELGENSYVGIAFDGAFELAEENISDDYGNSTRWYIDYYNKYDPNMNIMKKQLKQRDADCDAYKAQYEDMKELDIKHWTELQEVKEELAAVKEKNLELTTKLEEAEGRADEFHEKAVDSGTWGIEQWNKLQASEKKVEELELEIMKLKARLFDLIDKQ